ncbi:coproporphyrinogen-III oxidase family protein [Paenibacillus sp. M1]|uniref:Heme chaperone HemW n=1 Tax=Paenibacillus haidiansis TaxID=1574488 RepID=A0ABU7VST1_9BACL
MKRLYKVAIMNYPLMDPKIQTEDWKSYFGLDQPTVSSWKTPLYIHIPFCAKICNFCVYSRQVPHDNNIIQRYVNGLIREIMLYGSSPYVQSLTIDAIFIGGGTPTCLSSEQIGQLLHACRDYLPLSEDVEISIECNTTNADEEKIHRLHEEKVSRISAGIQTFNPSYRKLLGLQASEESVAEWIQMVDRYKFDSLAIDLMYGLPGQNIEEWLEDIAIGLSLPVRHFSMYELYIIAGSKMYNKMIKGLIQPAATEEVLFEMYIKGNKMLLDRGYERTILPEFHQAGLHADYWKLSYDGYGDNLAVGASSYGFINGMTYQNATEVNTYLKQVESGDFPISMCSGRAGLKQMMERTMVLALRRGYVEPDVFRAEYGVDINDVFGEIINSLIHEGLLFYDGERYHLTTQGEYVQGDVSVRFMESTFRNVSSLKKQLSIGSHVVPATIS